MGTKAKASLIILLSITLVLGLWQLSSPQPLVAVGTKYSTGPYASLGSWTVQESLSAGQLFLSISVSNLTYPRTSLSTTYSVVVGKVNETLTSPYAKSLTLRVTGLTIEDNYDGTTTSWGRTNGLVDGVQVTGLFFFRTSGNHNLRFTLSYQLYELLLVGSLAEHTSTKSFNVTQPVL